MLRYSCYEDSTSISLENRVVDEKILKMLDDGHCPFVTTRWTLVFGSRDKREDLSQLLQLYWQPVYAYLRQQGTQSDDAADVTQGFLTNVVIGGSLLSRADREQGRFRSYLLTALKNYRIDEHRRTRRDRDVIALPDDPESYEIEPTGSGDLDPVQAFDQQWATRVFDLATRRTRHACQEAGLDRHWRAFELRVLTPSATGDTPPGLPEVADAIGLTEVSEISHMIFTVKRKFRDALHRTLQETVDDAGQVEEELADLRAILAGEQAT